MAVMAMFILQKTLQMLQNLMLRVLAILILTRYMNLIMKVQRLNAMSVKEIVAASPGYVLMTVLI